MQDEAIEEPGFDESLEDILDYLREGDDEAARRTLRSLRETRNPLWYGITSSQETELLRRALSIGPESAKFIHKEMVRLKQGAASPRPGQHPDRIAKAMSIGNFSEMTQGPDLTQKGGTDNFEKMMTLMDLLLHVLDQYWDSYKSTKRDDYARHAHNISNVILDLTFRLYLSLEAIFQREFASPFDQSDATIVRLREKFASLYDLNNRWVVYFYESAPSLYPMIPYIAIEPKRIRIGSQERAATRTKSKTDYRAIHKDYFDPHSGPKVKVDFYGEKKEYPDEKDLSYDEFLKAREQQLALFDRLLSSQTSETSKQEMLVKAQSHKLWADGKGLHSEANWRDFIHDLYLDVQTELGGDAPEALRFVVQLLMEYFTAFAMSSKYNILDKPPDYLGRAFPRAATGQLIHDCGVFALKIAYILSILVSEAKLNLTFEFVRLPGHIVLVMRGAGFPVFVFQNNEVAVHDESDFQTWVEGNTDDTKSVEDAEGEVVGALAAQSFIPGANMPYTRVAIDTTRDAKKAIPKAFASTHDVFDRSDPARARVEAQEYLALSLQDTERFKDLTKEVNEAIAKIWNIELHNKILKDLVAMHDAGTEREYKKPRDDKKARDYKEARDSFDRNVEEYLAEAKAIIRNKEREYGWRVSATSALKGESGKIPKVTGREAEIERLNAKTTSHSLAPDARRSDTALVPPELAEPQHLLLLIGRLDYHVIYVERILALEQKNFRKEFNEREDVKKFFEVSPFVGPFEEPRE